MVTVPLASAPTRVALMEPVSSLRFSRTALIARAREDSRSAAPPALHVPHSTAPTASASEHCGIHFEKSIHS